MEGRGRGRKVKLEEGRKREERRKARVRRRLLRVNRLVVLVVSVSKRQIEFIRRI